MKQHETKIPEWRILQNKNSTSITVKFHNKLQYCFNEQSCLLHNVVNCKIADNIIYGQKKWIMYFFNIFTLFCVTTIFLTIFFIINKATFFLKQQQTKTTFQNCYKKYKLSNSFHQLWLYFFYISNNLPLFGRSLDLCNSQCFSSSLVNIICKL